MPYFYFTPASLPLALVVREGVKIFIACSSSMRSSWLSRRGEDFTLNCHVQFVAVPLLSPTFSWSCVWVSATTLFWLGMSCTISGYSTSMLMLFSVLSFSWSSVEVSSTTLYDSGAALAAIYETTLWSDCSLVLLTTYFSQKF